jgi:hypothetical protein
MQALVGLAVLSLAVWPVLAAERPTQTGDPIGVITMLADRSLQMKLRSVQCDGTIAEGEMTVLPDQNNYQSLIDHVGGLSPSETKVVLAWPDEPCPSK